MNREGTLHIVWLNRGQPVLPQYSVGFTDYASSGGAMKTRLINGQIELRNFLTGMGVGQGIVNATFENLSAEGATSVLRVVLSDDTLVSLGLKDRFLSGKEKVESAISLLQKQGHKVQPIVREDGTMWFEVDRQILVAWKQMQDLGDGVLSFEGLLHIYKLVIPVRFTVFFEPAGPILSYSVATPYVPTTFVSKTGAQYPNKESLVRTLDKIGLPGKEIAEMNYPTKVYTLTGSQLLFLNLPPPNIR